MSLLRNLVNVTKEEQKDFFNSFKHVLCDMDGVIWLFYNPLNGAISFIDHLKKINKNLTFITNNAMVNVDTIRLRLAEKKFRNDVHIINPILAIIEYLKKISFNKQIFSISTPTFKSELRKAGFNVAPDPPQVIEENVQAIMENIKDDTEIGAVVADYDLNVTRLKLQKALTYLKREDCLFIAGSCDKVLPIGSRLGPIIGNDHFYQALTEISGRKYIQIAKPSVHYLDYIMDTLKISDPESVLFIGDSIIDDMGFATRGGFQKLLVLSGNAQPSDIEHWEYPEEYKPNYYVENIGVLNNILEKVYEI